MLTIIKTNVERVCFYYSLYFYNPSNNNYFAVLLYACNVLAISIVTVIGPTPPGTGVIYEHFSATSA